MKRILSIQSFVAYGTVGNSIAAFALQRLGFEVIAVPTVFFSNHPGHGHFGGIRTSADQLDDILKALEEKSWFGHIDGILTGYLGAADHTAIIAHYIRLLKEKSPALIYCCDPVCGDSHTGLFVADDIPNAIKSELLPLADIATPNHFELTHLTGKAINAAKDVQDARQTMDIESLLCTSFPFSKTNTGEILATTNDLIERPTKRLDKVPHGAGDLLSALFLGHTLLGHPSKKVLSSSNKIVEKILSASVGAPELKIVEMQSLLNAGE